MRTITLEELLEAGCHFGHQVNRRNPKADSFIFEARSNIHIINLEKTHEGLTKAAEYLKELAEKNGNIIIIGTRRQAQQVVADEVKRAKSEGAKGIFSVTSRWIGGTLTNFPEVSKNFKRLKELNEFLSSSKKSEYTKREIVLFEREKAKFENLYGGIADLEKVPDALVIIGTQLEGTAVHEAISSSVTTVGIVDTNADPDVIDYPIPANDDAVGSIKLITSYLMDAWIEGNKIAKVQADKEEKIAQAAAAKEEERLKKEKAAATNRAHNA